VDDGERSAGSERRCQQQHRAMAHPIRFRSVA
jgi:hypothetical protein